MVVDFQCTDMLWEFKTTGVPWVLLEADLWQGVFEMMQQFEEADFLMNPMFQQQETSFFSGAENSGEDVGYVCSWCFWVRWNCSTFPETIANSLHLKMGGLWKIRRFRTWFHHHHFQVLFMLVSRRVTKKSWPLPGSSPEPVALCRRSPWSECFFEWGFGAGFSQQKWNRNIWGFPKMVGFPNWPMGFPTRNDQNLGCELGVPHHLRKHPFGTFLQTCYEVYSKSIREVLVGSEPSETGGG